jgi:hypothetical protein
LNSEDYLRTVRSQLATLALVLLVAISASAQAPRAYPFRATNYDVEVTLHPEDQTIAARVRVDFIAEAVSKTIVVELHPASQFRSCARRPTAEFRARPEFTDSPDRCSERSSRTGPSDNRDV